MWKTFAGKYIKQVKELLKKLTPSQRLSLGILGASVFLGILMLVFFAGRIQYRALAHHSDAAKLEDLRSRLHYADYDVKVENGVVKVKESQLPGALQFVASTIDAPPRRDGWKWLDEDPGWGETSVRIQEKKRRAKTINIEESIKLCDDIVDAYVELNVQNSSFTVLDMDDTGNSASVTVDLAPGVGALKPGQVRTIRNIVSGGASIPYNNISVTDNNLREYPVADEETGVSGFFDEKRFSYIKHYKKEISNYLNKTFEPAQYSLFVDVKLSRENVQEKSEELKTPEPGEQLKVRETVEEMTGRRTIGGGAPGTKPNMSAAKVGSAQNPVTSGGGEAADRMTVDTETTTKSEIEYSQQYGRTNTIRTIPPGEIKKISVAVRLDKDAVEKKLPEEGDAASGLPVTIPEYIKKRRAEIEQMLKIQGDATVSVEVDQLLTARTLLAHADTQAGIWDWMAENVSLIVLLLMGLGALGFAYTLARRAIPPPIEIPPVELPEEKSTEEDALKVEQEQKEAEHVIDEDVEFSEGLQQVTTLLKERPEIGAGVVKMWLGAEHQPVEETE